MGTGSQVKLMEYKPTNPPVCLGSAVWLLSCCLSSWPLLCVKALHVNVHRICFLNASAMVIQGDFRYAPKDLNPKSWQRKLQTEIASVCYTPRDLAKCLLITKSVAAQALPCSGWFNLKHKIQSMKV